ncbi:unnamed protein product [Clavelina lepadiformis]|uniref:Protein kinase domain-containing protein n=1 Tax=Clavelina lepadiformis TaxID=159417 RepID=A0ABP0F1R5_CLALP
MTNLSKYDASEILTPKGEIGLIGCGSSGRIRYCKNKKLGYFAVKCLALPGNTSGVEDKKKELLKEATILQKLTHKNIIQVHGITFWSHSIGIITDYFPIGNLDDLLVNKLIKMIIWLLRLRIAFEVSEALCFLHYYKPSKVLVHGDLKPQNIMLTEDLRVKLADFGSVSLVACTGASSLSTPMSANTQHTPYYTAPEFLKDFNKPRTAAMDVYSYSMVLYEILTRERVYGKANASMDIVVTLIISQGIRPEEKLTNVVRDGLTCADLEIFNSLEKVMKESWVKDPNERPQITCIRDQLYNLLKIYANPKELGEHICETVNFHQSSVRSQLSEFEKCEYISLDHFAHPYEKLLVEINNKPIVQNPSMPTQVVEDVASVKKPEMDERKTSPGMFLVCGSGQRYQLSKFVFETKDFDTISKFYINWEGNAIVSIGNMVFLLGPVNYSLNTEDKDPHWIKVRSMNKPRAHFKAVVAAGKIYVGGGMRCIINEADLFSSIKNIKQDDKQDVLVGIRYFQNPLDRNNHNAIVECYDPKQDMWTIQNNMRIPDCKHFCGMTATEQYIICWGRDMELNDTFVFNDYINDETYEVEPATHLLSKRVSCSNFYVTSVDGMLYGINLFPQPLNIAYNLKNKFWRKCETTPSIRSVAGMCYHEKKVYLFGT